MCNRSWRPFGTLWSRNITSDARTGIGAWTDQQIVRAIRSGITPDGRTLHWQAMIWDPASNWDEEDYPRARDILLHAPSRRPADPSGTVSGAGRLRGVHLLDREQYRSRVSLRPKLLEVNEAALRGMLSRARRAGVIENTTPVPAFSGDH